MEKLNEVDKLIKKLDDIYRGLGGEAGDTDALPTLKTKDKYQLLRLEITRLIGDTEALINQKEELPQVPENLKTQYEIEAKVDDKLLELNKKIKELRLEVKSYKKKNPKHIDEITTRENTIEYFDKRYMNVKNRHEGLPVDFDEKHLEDYVQVKDLDKIMDKQRGPNRELYQEERDKIDEADRRMEEQNKGLKMIHQEIKDLKQDVKLIGRQIDDVSRETKKTQTAADKTEKKLNTTNAKLKDMLKKLRGSDKFCIDIILVCVCLGLIAVLYNVISGKM